MLQAAETGSGSDGATSGGKKTPATTTQYVSMATTGSMERATEELETLDNIVYDLPETRKGETGAHMPFYTNYIKLKCTNRGLYQYVVNYDPPVDCQATRIRMLYRLGDVTGQVRLFDGYTLFLPVLLKEKRSTYEVQMRRDDPTVTVNVTIQLTKILPPERIPPAVFNIIFKKYFSLIIFCLV